MYDPRRELAERIAQQQRANIPPQPAVAGQQPAYVQSQPIDTSGGLNQGMSGVSSMAGPAMMKAFGPGAGAGAAGAGTGAGAGFTGAGVHAGAAGAGGAGGGMGSAIAAGGPYAALAALMIGNEMYAKDKGYRREGKDYYKDLLSGDVMWQDIGERWSPKIFGNSTIGNDMEGTSKIMQGNISEGWNKIKDEGILGSIRGWFD